MVPQLTWNGYSWVEGNPVMNTDPTGMQTERTRPCEPSTVQPGVYFCFPSCQGIVTVKGIATTNCEYVDDYGNIEGTAQDVVYYDEMPGTEPYRHERCRKKDGIVDSDSLPEDIRDAVLSKIQWVWPTNIKVISVTCHEESQKEPSRNPVFDPGLVPVPNFSIEEELSPVLNKLPSYGGTSIVSISLANNANTGCGFFGLECLNINLPEIKIDPVVGGALLLAGAYAIGGGTGLFYETDR